MLIHILKNVAMAMIAASTCLGLEPTRLRIMLAPTLVFWCFDSAAAIANPPSKSKMTWSNMYATTIRIVSGAEARGAFGSASAPPSRITRHAVMKRGIINAVTKRGMTSSAQAIEPVTKMARQARCSGAAGKMPGQSIKKTKVALHKKP